MFVYYFLKHFRKCTCYGDWSIVLCYFWAIFLFIEVKIAFFSLVGIKLYLINSFIRNVSCGCISLRSSFRAQAGGSEGPGGLFAFKLVMSFLNSISYTKRKENVCLRYFLFLVFLTVVSTTFLLALFSKKNIRV